MNRATRSIISAQQVPEREACLHFLAGKSTHKFPLPSQFAQTFPALPSQWLRDNEIPLQRRDPAALEGCLQAYPLSRSTLDKQPREAGHLERICGISQTNSSVQKGARPGLCGKE